MRIYDLAEVFRSKNAGPLYITIDMIFPDYKTFSKVVNSEVISQDIVANAYNQDPSNVKIINFDAANAIKITIPRSNPAGSIGDTDVYGTQMHLPLIKLEV